jgi:hypothetical protein
MSKDALANDFGLIATTPALTTDDNACGCELDGAVLCSVFDQRYFAVTWPLEQTYEATWKRSKVGQ